MNKKNARLQSSSSRDGRKRKGKKGGDEKKEPLHPYVFGKSILSRSKKGFKGRH